ncbi:DUF2997 domain-containing protein [Blastopirellula marina]|uniref:DUF2997 domain-containing protein n=1 Tax=Blastopirellula marina TaxID=124 RepID=A0A2S8GIH8_9BACT|nr:DUF2997 domain-containing protein [Blastopirellula marina]PQO43834.1 hypothetical protein C5Y93_21855 [Blastopirellula marina]
MSKTIEVIVAADGTSRVETNGFAGSDCREASLFLEQALGAANAEQLKPEFYQSVEAELNVRESA